MTRGTDGEPRKLHGEAHDQAEPDHRVVLVELDFHALAERVATLIVRSLEDRLAPPPPPWLDVPAAATHLGCSPERLRKLIQRKTIPFHQDRPGGRIFLHRKELDEWLLGQ